ncbi:MAG: T9SS type A sorting domain-containing protein [Flavobacteriaceae bacterium]|nr:T9SS type A sorting domain-containing protein [Flavobacteriaceae bacterium]
MKKFYLILSTLFFFNSLIGQVTVSPNPFEINEPITITIDANSTATNCNGFNNPNKVYAHLGVGDDNDEYGIKVIGNWGQDDGVGEMINNGNGTWSITFTTNTYFGLTPTQESNVTKMGMVFRNEDGSQEFKDNGCTNFIFDVGTFQVSLSSPISNSTTILTSGGNLNITASNIGGNANYVLKSNGAILNSQSNISSYSYNHTNITSNQQYVLEVTLDGTTITKTFSVLIDPGTIYQTLTGEYEDGINYDPNDPTKATLLLYANGKDFVYVAGSFNNWQPDASYAMKRDFSRNGRFWLTLTGLTPGQIETYQYWLVDKIPTTNSQDLVQTADPYSTLVLSYYDDPWIPTSTYPNLPAYPNTGNQFEVSILQTNQTPYNWQVTNFNKPKKEDLVVYEVLLRDFDADRNFQDIIDRISYFKNLNINAIELMPVMEFEGNESWGYNTVFHRALDKYYGTEEKLKELVDVCHQNGIAVILDIALNHAFGRNPMVRMWCNDPDGDGYGAPNTDNPYLNTVAKHSYSVGNDFNHQSGRTQEYVKSVIKHWIEEFHIDGFRWDLTKGFTQNCTENDQTCTNNLQPDRVAVLQDYADYSWSLDPSHYVIFEHLGSDAEEQLWANYRLTGEVDGISKGIMMWSEMWNSYKELSNGNASNFDRMGHTAHGFTEKRTLGYPESHDKDRIMYEMTTYGKTGTGYDIKDLNTALNRMSALGAVTLTIPGPKMVWHFADLGMDDSIWLCSDGVTVNSDYDGNNDGDCKLSTKPQPQWSENWLGNTNRKQVYDDWSRLIQLKTQESVFEGDYTIESGTLTPKIYVFDNTLPSTSLKNVVILVNFDIVSQNITPNFPYEGTWYDLMDETGGTSMNVTSTTSPINLAPGAFKIYGNAASTLSHNDIVFADDLMLYPNPATSSFSINMPVDMVSIYDTTGKLISTFKGGFQKNYEFNISNITQGLYIVIFKADSTSVSKRLLIN